MYKDCLDGIRAVLKDSFPKIAKIYVTTMPDEFTRPCFFVRLESSKNEDLGRYIYSTDMVWQVVYFAPKDTKRESDVFDQAQMYGKLQKVFMSAMYIRGPSGTIYHIMDVDGAPTGDEVYVNIELTVETMREEEQFDIVQEVFHEKEV